MEKNIRCARGHIFEYLNFVFRVLRAQAQAVKKCPLQSPIYMLRIAPSSRSPTTMQWLMLLVTAIWIVVLKRGRTEESRIPVDGFRQENGVQNRSDGYTVRIRCIVSMFSNSLIFGRKSKTSGSFWEPEKLAFRMYEYCTYYKHVKEAIQLERTCGWSEQLAKQISIRYFAFLWID